MKRPDPLPATGCAALAAPTASCSFISATLVAVCATMAITTVFASAPICWATRRPGRQRGPNAASRGRTAPELDDNLGFLMENGPRRRNARARFDDDGSIIAAAVVSQDAPPRALTAAQRAPSRASPADGAMHTRTLPGLGTTGSTALDDSGSGFSPAFRWATYRT